MEFPISSTFAAMPFKAKMAFYTAIVFALLLVLAGNGYAAAPTKASLKGPYAFQLSISKEAYWSVTKKCTYKAISTQYWAGGQSTYTELNYGTATFDGEGNVTLVMTDAHKLNQAASNATATIVCNSNGTATTDGGNLVYEPTAAPATVHGTYTVSSTGAAVLTLPDGGGTADLQLTLFNSAGLSTTFLMHTLDNDIGTGIGIHQ